MLILISDKADFRVRKIIRITEGQHAMKKKSQFCIIFPKTLSWWCHPTISSSVIPFSSCPQSFPTSESFPLSQLFASGGQSAGVSASASVLPMNIQGWFPLWLTGLISLQFKGFSRVFSSAINWKYQFFGDQPSLGSTLTSIHDYWKNHSFDYRDLCLQSDVSF